VRAHEDMKQMANTVNEMMVNVDEIRGNMGEIRDNMGEVKDNVGKIKDNVGEIKCSCSFTCIVFVVVETEALLQGTRSNRTFENGSPRRTRL
jgi:hypothetical protein